jgi:hypothetical protein
MDRSGEEKPTAEEIFLICDDCVTIALLYNVTKSKFAATINMMEFIPVIGDLLTVYTYSTLA